MVQKRRGISIHDGGRRLGRDNLVGGTRCVRSLEVHDQISSSSACCLHEASSPCGWPGASRKYFFDGQDSGWSSSHWSWLISRERRPLGQALYYCRHQQASPEVLRLDVVICGDRGRGRAAPGRINTIRRRRKFHSPVTELGRNSRRSQDQDTARVVPGYFPARLASPTSLAEASGPP